MKHLCYRSLAILMLMLLLPFMILASIAIFILMGRPIIFTQPRLGLHKRLFTIYKFRSMQDGKVTLLGKILRASGIDEAPQLLNIIKGDMSFVGPRPLTIEDIQRLHWESNYYQVRWSVLPGITGLAQLSLRCHKKISWFYDKQYIHQQSFMLDIYVVLKSLLIPIIGKNLSKKIFSTKRKKAI